MSNAVVEQLDLLALLNLPSPNEQKPVAKRKRSSNPKKKESNLLDIEVQPSLFGDDSPQKKNGFSEPKKLFSKEYLDYLENAHKQIEKKKARDLSDTLMRLCPRQYEYYRYLLGQYNYQIAYNYISLVTQEDYLRRNPVLKDSMDCSPDLYATENIDETEDTEDTEFLDEEDELEEIYL